MTRGMAAGPGDAGALRMVAAAGAGVVSAGAGAMAWSSPSARPTYGGSTFNNNVGPQTINATINTQGALGQSEKSQLVRDIADAQREATALVSMELGVAR
jgi:hypothetical protein